MCECSGIQTTICWTRSRPEEPCKWGCARFVISVLAQSSHLYSHRHTDTQTRRHTYTQTHRHTDTQTDTQMHTHTHRCTTLVTKSESNVHFFGDHVCTDCVNDHKMLCLCNKHGEFLCEILPVTDLCEGFYFGVWVFLW